MALIPQLLQEERFRQLSELERWREVAEKVKKEFRYGEYSSPRTTSKVEPSGTVRSSGSARTFENLPEEAKTVCERQASKIVRAGTKFDTLEKWKDHYVKNFDWEAK